MQKINEIKYNIKELQKRYYEVEKELKESNNYTLGDGSDEDIENSKKIILWINIRNEIFYNRIKLVKAYETIL